MVYCCSTGMGMSCNRRVRLHCGTSDRGGSCALLLLAHFIMPQYYIHQMLMKTKKEWLEQFSKKLSAKANEAFPAQPEIIFFVLGAF